MPVMAAPTGPGARCRSLPELDELAQAGRAVLDEALGEVRAAHPDLDIDPQVVEGPAARRSCTQLEGADLVVVGTQGHGTVDRHAARIGQPAPVRTTPRAPVVLVPSPEVAR